MPLWFVSCQRRNEAKIPSRGPIQPSPLPPFTGLSYSANARKPFGVAEGGCGVKLPNNSVPLSIVPLPLRSKASQASSESAAVHAHLSDVPSLSRSNATPLEPSVRSKPLPAISSRIGLPLQIYLQVISSM